jgi:threonine/homoserine/homoserine lactone efflux protein
MHAAGCLALVGLDMQASVSNMAEIALVAFAAVAFIAIATPGPAVMLALSNGSRFGVPKACFGMLGAVLSNFVLIGAVALGLGALLAASEFWFSAVKWIGVCYLAYLGTKLLRSKGTLDAPAAPVSRDDAGSARSVFLKSLFVSLTNPKDYIFFAAILPQFIDSAQPQLMQYSVLALIFNLIEFVVMSGYAMLGSQAARTLSTSGALWLDRACGGTLLALAGSLAFYVRASA